MEVLKKIKLQEFKKKMEQPFQPTIATPKKQKKLSNDPIFNILRANERIFGISEKINNKLKQICERIDVDRPILMRDKLDFMWKEASKDNVDIEFVEG